MDSARFEKEDQDSWDRKSGDDDQADLWGLGSVRLGIGTGRGNDGYVHDDGKERGPVIERSRI